MYVELNISNIVKGHLNSFRDKSKRFSKKDKWAYFYIPVILSFVLGIMSPLSSETKDIISICISILIGLLFNLLVLVLTNIDTQKFKNHIVSDRITRVHLIKETFYNVSFSVLISIWCLINLFLIDVFKFSAGFNDSLYLVFAVDVDSLFQSIMQIILYFAFIQTFLVLFMILKRIEKLFRVEMETELDNLEKEAVTELNSWDE